MRQAKPKAESHANDPKAAMERLPRRASIGARRNPETAQAILDAAEALLRERGAGGFSIEAVARRAGAGKPTIYRWWPNKAALLLEVYARRKLDLPLNDTGSVQTDLQAMIAGVFDFWAKTASGQVFRSIIAEAQIDDVALQALRSYLDERVVEIAVIFERGRARRELAPEADPRVLAELLSGYLWQRLLLDRLPTDPDEIARTVTHIAQHYAGSAMQAHTLRSGKKPRAQHQ